jgi:hypothetical protein
MAWTYQQDTGDLFDPDGSLVGVGYSGHPPYVNDHSAEGLVAHGPLPCGRYEIGEAHEDGHLGPVVMRLTPVPPFDALGRTLIDCHGDNDQQNHTASDGCLILARFLRELLAASADRIIDVVLSS